MNIDFVKATIEKFSHKQTPDEVDAVRIRSNPQYAQVITKLEELYVLRGQLVDHLEKIELDIEACLIMVAMKERKEEIDKNKIK